MHTLKMFWHYVKLLVLHLIVLSGILTIALTPASAGVLRSHGESCKADEQNLTCQGGVGLLCHQRLQKCSCKRDAVWYSGRCQLLPGALCLASAVVLTMEHPPCLEGSYCMLSSDSNINPPEARCVCASSKCKIVAREFGFSSSPTMHVNPSAPGILVLYFFPLLFSV